MWGTIIRAICALFCALVVHAALVTGAVYLGFSSNSTTLPELDLTSVDLSFSETPEETAAPVAQPPPSPAVEAPPPTPPPAVFEPPPPPPAIELPPRPAVEPPPPPDIELPPLPDIEPPPPPVVEPPPDPTPPEPEPQNVQELSPKHQETPPPTPQAPVAAPPPTPAPSQARVAVDKPPSPRRRIRPEYPKGARQRREEGDVTLDLAISADGTVDGVEIVASCGFPELEQAAIQAVKHARFTPARRGSTNVPSTARLTLTFRLKD